jgi:predicted DNA-binding protein YlxM (UPF0122 family)
MYFRDELSINEIARRTSLSRNTVKKWLKMPNGNFYRSHEGRRS